jgi:hypothetical protein
MIKDQLVNGKRATVAYLKEHSSGGFEPVDPKQALMIKVIYEDGSREMYFPDAWAKQKVTDA